jgi:hypothetical protein
MSGVKKEQLEKRRSDIISAIKELGGIATPAQVAKLMGNVKGENIRKSIGRMAQDGILMRVGQGIYRLAGDSSVEKVVISERKSGISGVVIDNVLGESGGSKSVGKVNSIKELVIKALLGEVKSVYVLYVKYDFWKWLDGVCIMCPDIKVASKIKTVINERYKVLTPSQLRGFVSIVAETKGKTVGEILDEAFIGCEEVSVSVVDKKGRKREVGGDVEEGV